MSKERILAFSDGVLAIIITIMVLELRPPEDVDLASLLLLLPSFLSYTLSFVFIGIYWNNHHHLFQAVDRVNGRVLWANLFLLFWLSLIPFATVWMGDTSFAALPVALYGVLLLMSAFAYFILTHALMRLHDKDSVLVAAVGNDFKGKLSIVLYVVAILLTFVNSWLACGLYVLVAIMWLVPDKRIEKLIK